MKFILLVIGIILLVLVFRGSSENFNVNEAIFNEVDIPTDSDLAKDPYYQKIKNRDWVCACGEGKEKNSRNECVPFCPPGQSRFTDDNCYPPCPTGQTRHTNAVCYPPCPSGEFRNPSGVCQCTPQQPLYDLFTNHDIGGFDLGGTCLKNNAGGVWPAWANEAKARCDNNPGCKAYNLISSGGAWGNDWGSCMKTKSDTPSRVPLSAKIDYYRKIETSRNNNGVCSTECPAGKTNVNGICQCPAEQTIDAYGVCQWNPCPTGQTRDSNGVCQWPPCPTGQTRHTNGICYPPCLSGQTRDANGVCQWPDCPANSTVNQTTGQCTCNPGFEVATPFGFYHPEFVNRNQKCDRPCAAGVKRDVEGVCGGNATINIPGFSSSGGSCPPGRFKDITGRCV